MIPTNAVVSRSVAIIIATSCILQTQVMSAVSLDNTNHFHFQQTRQQLQDNVVCDSNKDAFSSIVVVSYVRKDWKANEDDSQRSRGWVSPEELATFELLYERTFNDINQVGNSDDGTCDPLFREITSVTATVNVTLSGGDIGWSNDRVGAGARDGNGFHVTPLQPVRRLRNRDIAREWQGELLERTPNKKPYEFQRNEDEPETPDDDHRNLQISSQASPTSAPTTLSDLFSGGRTGASNIQFMLVDIFGSCRACSGNSVEFDLFDDGVTGGRRQGRQLYKYADNDGDGDGTGTDEACECPPDVDLAGVRTEVFKESLTQNIRATDDVNFVETVQNIIPVEERKCLTNADDIEFLKKVEFDIPFGLTTSMLYQRAQVKRELENDFVNVYNRLAQDRCDPLFRSIDDVQLISVRPSDTNNTHTTIEFLVDLICRGVDQDGGDDCSVFGDGDGGSASNEGPTMNRSLIRSVRNEDSMRRDLRSSEGEGDLISRKGHRYSHRRLQSKVRILTTADGESERCFCPKRAKEEPPNKNDFQIEYARRIQPYWN